MSVLITMSDRGYRHTTFDGGKAQSFESIYSSRRVTAYTNSGVNLILLDNPINVSDGSSVMLRAARASIWPADVDTVFNYEIDHNKDYDYFKKALTKIVTNIGKGLEIHNLVMQVHDREAFSAGTWLRLVSDGGGYRKELDLMYDGGAFNLAITSNEYMSLLGLMSRL